jgi:hypothetical protein
MYDARGRENTGRLAQRVPLHEPLLVASLRDTRPSYPASDSSPQGSALPALPVYSFIVPVATHTGTHTHTHKADSQVCFEPLLVVVRFASNYCRTSRVVRWSVACASDSELVPVTVSAALPVAVALWHTASGTGTGSIPQPEGA